MADQPDNLVEDPDDLPRWRRMVPLVLALLLAVALALIVFLADRAAEQRDRAIALQRHSYEVMLVANRLDATISRAEAMLIRHIGDLDPETGGQFMGYWQAASTQTDELEEIASQNQAQITNVAALKAALAARGAVLRTMAKETDPDGRLTLLENFDADGRVDSMDAIRNALGQVIAHEQAELARSRLLVDRSELQVSRVNDSYALIGLGLVAAVLLALWFAYSALRERGFARHIAAAEAARVDDLEAAVRERTEALEEANGQLRREMDVRALAEQSLRKLQKMEAIGKLTGGIAHDFNNMLAVIVSGIELARQTIRREPAKARRHLDSAMEGANRASALTMRLLAFARPELPLATAVDADALVLGMRDLIDRATDEGIGLVFDLTADGWLLWVEQAQLEHALLNLAINARDAMEGRGTLTIATRRLTLAPGEVGQCPAGDYVCLSVTDTGCGMTQDVQDRAFEPFFTTKPVGKGTGLGLSQIFGFVGAAGGEVDLRSTPGEGTTIRLIVPRHVGVEDEPELELELPEPARQRDARLADPALAVVESFSSEPPDLIDLDLDSDAGGRGRLVLVVEDDPRVLRSTLAALKALGHRGLPCDHPSKAADLLAAHGETALILSDVLMPDMTGPEMIAALGDMVKDIPVIFVTGFAGEGGRAAQLANVPILPKPFTLVQLGRAIEEAFTASRRGLFGDPMR